MKVAMSLMWGLTCTIGVDPWSEHNEKSRRSAPLAGGSQTVDNSVDESLNNEI